VGEAEERLDEELRRRFVDPSGEAFQRLVAVMARLRAPDGCPWDAEQTHATLARHLVEETYEVLEAIDSGDLDALREELGDLVIQIVFHSNIAFEEGAFTIADVLDELRSKLIRRHPHVFGDVEVSGAEEVKANWERIKRTEKPRKIYEGIPKALPALARAAKMQRRTADAGLDWLDTEEVFAGLAEEIDELRAELARPARDPDRIEAELGDVLFVAAALGNKLGVDPEGALRKMLERSEARVRTVERIAAELGRDVESLSPEDWRQYWDQAKKENP
jgi:tetrapyrrole methylase family protein/MazG family protein